MSNGGVLSDGKEFDMERVLLVQVEESATRKIKKLAEAKKISRKSRAVRSFRIYWMVRKIRMHLRMHCRARDWLFFVD